MWWDILYETLYCLRLGEPAWASQPLEPWPKVVDAEFEISQRFLPRRSVSSDHHDVQDDDDDDVDYYDAFGDDDDDDDNDEDRDLEMEERVPFKSERSAKFPEEPETH